MAGADYGELIYRNGIYQTHATELGSGRVRASFHKMFPVVRVDGDELDVSQWLVDPVSPDNLEYFADTDESEYHAEIEGCTFQARHVGGNMLDIELTEPDGTIWQARGGYEIGEQFMEDGETPEQVYRHLMSHRFRWTQVAQSHSTE